MTNDETNSHPKEQEKSLESAANAHWKDLAPGLVRQRVVIECTTPELVGPGEIKDYLVKLSQTVNMKPLSEPFAYPATGRDGTFMGWGGWLHWVTSGVHVYSYPTIPPLFTVDAYTCKPFSVDEAVEFTRDYFKTIEIVWKVP